MNSQRNTLPKRRGRPPQNLAISSLFKTRGRPKKELTEIQRLQQRSSAILSDLRDIKQKLKRRNVNIQKNELKEQQQQLKEERKKILKRKSEIISENKTHLYATRVMIFKEITPEYAQILTTKKKNISFSRCHCKR